MILGADAANDFRRLGGDYIDGFDGLAMKMGWLEGLVANAEGEGLDQASLSGSVESSGMAPGAAPLTRRIFVVHGHDSEVKETVARFIEKVGLEPVILHEQPSRGRTVIEKLEVWSRDAAFAVVILTPDDVGGAASSAADRSPRARQNVILELGYFLGRLGRSRVCAIHKGGVELPSDYKGVLYIEFDAAGAWRTTLAQEFVEAKLPIKVEALINK